MKKRRIGYALWLVCTAALHLFGNTSGTLTLLALSAAYLPVAVLLMHASAWRMRASAAWHDADRGVSGTLHVSGLLFPMQVVCRLTCRNLFTGEQAVQTLNCAGRSTSFSVTVVHCGAAEITLDAFLVRDPLGIVGSSANPHLTRSWVTLPDAYPMTVDAGLTAAQYTEGDRFLMQPGNDSAETYALREYVAGDALERIHWKLTEKVDKLLVRQPSRPATRQMLVLIAGNSPSPAQSEAMVQTFASLSQALTAMQLPHTLGWTDAESGLPVRRVVDEASACADALGELMRHPLCGGVQVTVDELSAYAHTVIICEDAAEYSGRGITLLPVTADVPPTMLILE